MPTACMIGSNTLSSRKVRGQSIVWHRKAARTTMARAYIRKGRVSNAPGYPGLALPFPVNRSRQKRDPTIPGQAEASPGQTMTGSFLLSELSWSTDRSDLTMKTTYLIATLAAASLPLAGLVAEDSAKTDTPSQKHQQTSGMMGKGQMMSNCKNRMLSSINWSRR